MTSRRFTSVLLVSVSGFLLPIVPLEADDDSQKNASTGLESLPKACQEYVRTFGDDIEILEIEKERENNTVVYEVEMLVAGREVELELSVDGSLIEGEERIDYNELPEPVREAIDWSPDSKRAIRITEITKIVYEVEIEGKRGKQVIDGAGRIRAKSDNHDNDD